MASHGECRMYESKYPEVDDVVMVQVKSIAEMGAYVALLEYNGIEGMILLSELSRRRIRSITKLIKVGRQEPVMVLRVDKEKGYIDLSKRRVSPEDITRCEETFNKSKLVHSIMRHVAETTGQDVDVETDVCPRSPLSSRLQQTTSCNACEACMKSIEKARGKLIVKEAARAVSERDDRLLTEQLEKLESANKEVDGDEDSDDEDEEGMGDIDVESGPALLEV
ncbi:MAG: hypothetical protein WDW38_000595 [Sanguina aurantia]